MSSLLQVAGRELKRLASHPIYGFCMIVAPLLCLVFFVTLMQSGLPTDLPLGLVDDDGSTTSRQLARNLDAFQQTDIVARFPTVSDARKAMQEGRIYGFYYIPEGTSRKALRQEQATVSFYMNYSYLIAGSLVFRDMKTMSELASGAAAQQVMLARGATEAQAMAMLQPIVIDTHPLNNPWLNYSVYLNNTLIPGVLMLFITMITVYSIGIEVKENTAREWLGLARFSLAKALSGKLLPQTAVFAMVWWLVDTVLYAWLRFPCLCGLPTMWGVSLLGVLAAQGLGVFMFSALPTLRLGLSFASLWGVISFSISGISFPVMAMHPVLQGLCNLFPLRHYFLLYVNFALNGYHAADIWPNLAGLCAFALLPLAVGWRLKHVLLTVKYVP
mgnify:CR=1 FL=1